MKFDPQKHHRRSIRLPRYDYSQSGAYYITIVAWEREHLFGEVVNAGMKLNRFGQIVQYAWYDLPKHYPHVELNAFCIMPNHVHAIIVLTDRIVTKRHPLSEVVRAFKSFSARRINSLRKTQGIPVWQRNYYEHVIRDEKDLQAKRDYILSNPLNWERDDENTKR
jgi:REP element-mobilizing transposase RayT